MVALNPAGGGFDPSSVPDADYLPAGEYEVRIIDSEINPTKAGTGQVLTLRMKVESGKEAGRLHFERLNIQNPNATAQRIAQQTLKKIMKATGFPEGRPLTDSEELHHKPFIAKLKVTQQDGFDPQAQLSAARPIGGAPPSSPATASGGGPQQGSPQPATAGANERPW